MVRLSDPDPTSIAATNPKSVPTKGRIISFFGSQSSILITSFRRSSLPKIKSKTLI